MRGGVVDGCGRCDEAESHRIYCCGRCGKLVVICRRCDRGNVYCAAACAELSRRESNRRHGRNYQQSGRGRMKHADRQACYRERLRQKVTQQGFAAAPPLPTEDRKQSLVAEPVKTATVAVEPEDQASARAHSSAFEIVPEDSTAQGGSFDPRTPLDTFASVEVYGEARCDFCGQRCGVYSRNGFLTRR
jgi:hypothetical protein